MKMKYEAVLPNGDRVNRKSDRIYTHVVAYRLADGRRQREAAAQYHRQAAVVGGPAGEYAVSMAAFLDKQADSFAAAHQSGKWGVAGFCGSLKLASKLLGVQQKRLAAGYICECRIIPVSVVE